MKKTILLLLFLIAVNALSAPVLFVDTGSTTRLSFAVQTAPEGAYVPAFELFNALSGTLVYSAEKRKLLVHLRDVDLQFTEGNPYAAVGDSILNLVFAPRLINNEPFLYVPTLQPILAFLYPGPVSFDATQMLIRLKPPVKDKAPVPAQTTRTVKGTVRDTLSLIRKAVCEERKNGTLLTLYLPDSLTFDFTYFKPQLNINVFRGKVSVQDLALTVPAGLIKSIEAVQFADNAQIAVQTADRVQLPEVLYLGNPPRIEITVRPFVETPVVTTAPAPPVPESTAAPVPATPQARQQTARSIRTIILDPGHGGKDPGAVNKELKLREKDAVLDIAIKLSNIISARMPGVSVKLTRDSDTFIPLRERIRFANRNKGDLFVSLHANSVKGNAAKRSTANGYCVYFLDVAKNEEARAAAALENSVLELEDEAAPEANGSDLDFILKSSEINVYRNESEAFAILLEKEMDKSLSEMGRNRTGVSQAGFYVLKGPEMPAILFETAFISNPVEAKQLTNGTFQQKMAEAIFKSIEQFNQKRESGKLGQ